MADAMKPDGTWIDGSGLVLPVDDVPNRFMHEWRMDPSDKKDILAALDDIKQLLQRLVDITEWDSPSVP